MAITSADIHNQSFSIDRKGYDVDEVDVFLEHVADEIDALNNQIASLEDQLDDAKFDGFDTPAAPVAAAETAVITPAAPASVDTSEYEDLIAEKDDIIADLERQLEEKKANDSAISAALVVAQRSADEIVAKANAQAAETIQDARDEATRILNRANADKQAVLDSIRKLEDEREDVRDEYADILKDFITDASRKLSDLGGVVTASTAVSAAAHYVTPSQPAALGTQDTGEFELGESQAAPAPAPAPVAYTTPQAADAVVAAPTPVASAYEKDLSGFGDADDFEFEEID
ncbi:MULTISPECIES: DivIVA domain-containing protein [unclassified Adlercreutzia]|uniref:DivIVA domain-containing protein n=1 Tax=unclassified Adlercreutzia TaxID=2636013 RepID=UPI0013EB855E|nr:MULTISPECIES: DivIVA domain-containing protein [unclassified Adlercreutzia]